MKRPYYATSVGKHADERKAFLKKYRDFQYPANEEAYDLCYTGDKETAEREAKRIVTAVKWEIASFNMRHRPMVLSATAQDEDNERETLQNRACAVLGAGRKRTRRGLRKPVQANNACHTSRQQKPPMIGRLDNPAWNGYTKDTKEALSADG